MSVMSSCRPYNGEDHWSGRPSIPQRPQTYNGCVGQRPSFPSLQQVHALTALQFCRPVYRGAIQWSDQFLRNTRKVFHIRIRMSVDVMQVCVSSCQSDAILVLSLCFVIKGCCCPQFSMIGTPFSSTALTGSIEYRNHHEVMVNCGRRLRFDMIFLRSCEVTIS